MVRRGAPRPNAGYRTRPGPRSVDRLNSAIAWRPIFLRAGSCTRALSRLAPASSPFAIVAAINKADPRSEAILSPTYAIGFLSLHARPSRPPRARPGTQSQRRPPSRGTVTDHPLRHDIERPNGRQDQLRFKGGKRRRGSAPSGGGSRCPRTWRPARKRPRPLGPPETVLPGPAHGGRGLKGRPRWGAVGLSETPPLRLRHQQSGHDRRPLHDPRPIRDEDPETRSRLENGPRSLAAPQTGL